MGQGQGGEKPGDSRQQDQLQRQTEHQPQGVHFQLRHWIRGLDRRHQALAQKSQEHQAGKHEESFGW